jgi:poly-beta-1,6-N-acetyl-D-glucosamine synthase
MELVFWIALGFVLYVYAGYPLVLAIWARLRPRHWRRAVGLTPPVTIVIAARDEAARLPGRIENLLALDYPADRLEIIVVSDGSTDRTREALRPYVYTRRPSRGTRRLPVVRFIERAAEGKAAALNAGVTAAAHDILVFTDARQRFARDAVTRLVENFADARVGGVSGELVLDCELGASTSSISDSVGTYWRYEKWLRARESEIDSMIGATGAIYALRRAAWRPLPHGIILDDVLAPMRAVLSGWRVVLDDRARAFDTTAPDTAAEMRRKTRTLAGNWQMLTQAPQLLMPGLNRTWLQYGSHKIGRLLVPFALVLALVANLALAARTSWVYSITLLVQLAFYGLALYGAGLERRRERAAAVAHVVSHRRERKAVNV